MSTVSRSPGLGSARTSGTVTPGDPSASGADGGPGTYRKPGSDRLPLRRERASFSPTPPHSSSSGVNMSYGGLHAPSRSHLHFEATYLLRGHSGLEFFFANFGGTNLLP